MNHKYQFWGCNNAINYLVESLQGENISVCTTDTIPGFLSVISETAFEKINKSKGRYEKPYIILIPSKKEMFQFVNNTNNVIENLVQACWPGPLTLIFKAKEGLPNFVQSRQGTIALRVPDHKGLLAVMEKVGPLFSTSANKAGMPAPENVDQIDPKVIEDVDFVFSYKNEKNKSAPSTILDCTDPENIKVVREGAYSIQQLEKIINRKLAR